MSRIQKPDRQSSRSPDLLLSRDDVEAMYGLPRRWLELAAHKGDGPRYLKISRRMVRYRANDVEAWLSERVVDPAAPGER